MGKRTFAIGDIHGDLEALLKTLGAFPKLTKEDTLLFVGDYIDRGPKSREVVDYIRRLAHHAPAKVVWSFQWGTERRGARAKTLYMYCFPGLCRPEKHENNQENEPYP